MVRLRSAPRLPPLGVLGSDRLLHLADVSSHRAAPRLVDLGATDGLASNYEEGGENNILHGDAASEAFLSEIIGAAPWPGMRHMNMESIYEYGARAGFWRLHRMFTERSVPVTVYAVATAMARNAEAVAAMNEAGWEIATHGLKWIDYRDIPPDVEARHIAEAVRIHTEVAGARPLGFYQARSSQTITRVS